ncbi:MAG: 3-dehydroquinate synthase [Pseudomonadota bacterium]
MSQVLTVPVQLGDRGYDVLVGDQALEYGAAKLARLCPRGRAVIIADTAALKHHETRLNAALQSAGLSPDIIELEGGEAAKSWDGIEALCDTLLDLNLERSEAVIAFGGGTIGDLAGFAGAIVKRGVGFAQIPTTLLAQVDSSVGGKTGINTRHGKNLIGAFHQPGLVIADTGFLSTLPAREVRAGYAEIVKAGLIGDPALFERLETLGQAALSGEALSRAIADAVRFKARIVAEDEREGGVRALLNLGHTFAHAFEAEAEPGALIHGEAVAAGVALAFRYSARLGVCGADSPGRVEAHLRAVGLPARIADLPGGPYRADRLVERMGEDKKNQAGQITLILARGAGEAYIATGADRASLTRFLKDEINER